jgi:hypothetical protein
MTEPRLPARSDAGPIADPPAPIPVPPPPAEAPQPTPDERRAVRRRRALVYGLRTLALVATALVVGSLFSWALAGALGVLGWFALWVSLHGGAWDEWPRWKRSLTLAAGAAAVVAVIGAVGFAAWVIWGFRNFTF